MGVLKVPKRKLALCVGVLLLSPPAFADGLLSVLGQGKARQAQELDHDYLATAMPGTNPLKALEILPGVHFESVDAQGNYEWSTRFSVRGFNQSQLGFTLDGVPLGDMSYSNNNGLHISRAISAENLAGVTVSQGSGAVGTATTSNLGGTVQFVSMAPAKNFGVTASQLVGDNDTVRSFVRFDTGEFENGTRAYLSATRQRNDKWTGEGRQEHDQINAKLVHRFGSARLTAFLNLSNRIETDYQDMSLEMTRRLGWNWDNYAPDWQRAVNAAKGIFTGGVQTLDDAYYLGQGLRRDALGGATLNMRLGEAYWSSTVYGHKNDGEGHWYTPYTASSASIPIAIRTTEYTIDRKGWINDLAWQLNDHKLNAGLWLERSKHGLERNFYAVGGPEDTGHFLSNPISQGFAQDFTTTTAQAYVQDTFALLDDSLTINIGAKSPHVRTDATRLSGTQAQGSIKANAALLPQLGLNYLIEPGREIFASLTENMRAFQPGVIGPFSQMQAAFDSSADKLKPEKATTAELGYRYQGFDWSGSVTAYHVQFRDRLLAVAVCTGIMGCPTTFVTVGKVVTNGIESALMFSLSSNLSLFGSLTFNDSKYTSDYLDGGVLVRASGKRVVDSPRTMAAMELAYDNPAWYAKLGAKYTGNRYYTYLNDSPVPGYAIATLAAGWRIGSIGDISNVTAQLNINNLFDKRYYATVGTNGFIVADPTGTFQTLLHGASRQVFLTVSGKF